MKAKPKIKKIKAYAVIGEDGKITIGSILDKMTDCACQSTQYDVFNCFKLKKDAEEYRSSYEKIVPITITINTK